MAINKKIIHFKNKENFDNEVANGNILDRSIVFIQDSKEISTHGTVYKTVNWSVLEPELYEWVDLGLPSGTLWAAWNVGATKPEEYGLYFAWGETQGYSDVTDTKKFDYNDYKFFIYDNNLEKLSITKYNANSLNGTVDNLTRLELIDDAAYQSDNTCRMPTKADFEELIASTTETWETLNNINGRRFTSKVNSNSIFIPAAGYCVDSYSSDRNICGYYQSSSIFEEDPSFYYNEFLCFSQEDEAYIDNGGRESGNPIRPVKSNN